MSFVGRKSDFFDPDAHHTGLTRLESICDTLLFVYCRNAAGERLEFVLLLTFLLLWLASIRPIALSLCGSVRQVVKEFISSFELGQNNGCFCCKRRVFHSNVCGWSSSDASAEESGGKITQRNSKDCSIKYIFMTFFMVNQ